MSSVPLKITAELTPDPQICKFILDRDILPDRTIGCRDKETAKGAPLFEALFEIEGVREVLVSGNIITISKSTEEPWQVIGKHIGAAIREVMESEKPPIPSDWEKKPPSESSISEQVEKIIASRINPGVSAHGGKIELVDVKGTSVYLRLSGGCQGCGAANVTLKQGIEKAIRAKIPEITEIIDVTDHGSGKTPFYKQKRADGSPFQR
jgi:NFU1 iron-sulfur cluster scaffold homolog, mitochondrial